MGSVAVEVAVPVASEAGGATVALPLNPSPRPAQLQTMHEVDNLIPNRIRVHTDDASSLAVTTPLAAHLHCSTPALPPSLVAALVPRSEHAAYTYLARLAPGSRRTMATALATMASMLSAGAADVESLPWACIRYQHSQALRAALSALYAPATCNRHLSALRGVLKEAWRLGQIGADDYHRATDIERVRGEALPAGRALSASEVRSLFKSCRTTAPGDVRDAALLAVLYGAGLRRAEAVALDVADYDHESGALTVRNGKGAKARVVYVVDGGQAAVEGWLAIRGVAPGPLFVPVTKGGVVELRRMSAHGVYRALARRAKKAGVASFSPHDLRRSFVSDLLDAGADILSVQQLAGHASVQTTARYDRRGERAKQKAAAMLRVPY